MTPQSPQMYVPPSRGTSGWLIALAIIGILAVLGLVMVVGGLLLWGAASSAPTVLVNDLDIIPDGKSRVWVVPKGTHHVEITATGDGASVKWTGAECVDAKETHLYDTTCTLTRDAQVEVGNPTVFGLGADTSVNVKITRLK